MKWRRIAIALLLGVALPGSVSAAEPPVDETSRLPNILFFFADDQRNDTLSCAKGALFEGGIRVSTCVTWPGVIKSGSRCYTPLTSVDLLPTFTEIAGAQLPKHQPVDGRSFLPLLKGKKALDERAIFWHYPL